MSKRTASRRAPSGSPALSLGDSIEIDDALPDGSKRNSKAGKSSIRPMPKGRATNPRSPGVFRGAPISRIKGPQVEKRTTRSTSNVQKRRAVSESIEDQAADPDTPSKKKLRIHDSEDDDNFAGTTTPPLRNARSAPFTPKSSAYANMGSDPLTSPSQKGKSKREAILSEDEVEKGGKSDDWDEEEMELAFGESRNLNSAGHGESSKGDRRGSDDLDAPVVKFTTKNVMPIPSPTKTTKMYLEDFENFTIKGLPKNDESFFVDVQDPLLRKQYRDLPPLRIGYLLSWSTTSPDVPNIPYSEWPNLIPTMDIGKGSSIMYMITMVIQGRFFNPCRASPVDFVSRESYRSRFELFLEKKPAVAIITGYCTESSIVHGKSHKSVAVLFHGQEWERYCCFVNMVFNQKQMFAQLYKTAISFSTLPESFSAPPTFATANVSPLSGRRAKINNNPVDRARGALYFTDKVPIFDARNTRLDDSVDFDNLSDTFPLFHGEIPKGSCIAVGHSVSSYRGKKGSQDSGEEGNTMSLGTSILFAIVFGIPDF